MYRKAFSVLSGVMFAISRLVAIKRIISGKRICKATFDSTFSGFGDGTIVGQLFLVMAGFFEQR